jgi:site-specific DNA-methyltransferase (adenine-specific)
MINIYLGDSLEAMKAMKENSYDLAIVDPPYGININESMGRRKGQKHSGYKKATWDNGTPSADYFQELFRVSNNQIIWGGNYFLDHLYSTPCFLMWDKGFSEDVTFAQYELAWTSFKTSSKKYDKSPNQQHRTHPTQKPVALYKWLLKNYAKEGDKIFDSHGGSMSSVIACIEMGFDIDCWEIDKDYFQSAKKRIMNHVSQLNAFQSTPEINFYE